MGIFRGQGATEYLVLLAVVLIVALVSVALLGFFPGMAADARITQSQTYWRGQAKPFAILDSSMTTAGLLTVSIQNIEATGPYTIPTNGILVNGAGTVTTAIFAGGETKLMAITTGLTCASGAVYDYNVTISYTTAAMGATALKQYGAKNLIGKCV